MKKVYLIILFQALCCGYSTAQRVFSEVLPYSFSDSSGRFCSWDAFGYRNIPEYLCTCNNLDAAKTTQTHLLWPGAGGGLNLSGANLNKLGIWDGGYPRQTHVEFSGRILNMDSAAVLSAHATAVAGNMMATGINPNVKGMSFGTQLKSWNFTNDNAEIMAAAPDLFVSNHSYATTTAWTNINGQLYWYGDTSLHPTRDWKFGYYDNRSRIWDSIMYAQPYFLMVKASGNDRGSGVAPNSLHYYWNGSNWALSNTTRDTVGPYDCISTFGNAKNILCVGAIPTYPNGLPVNINPLSYSTWGPTDDGRIKPDLVAASGSILSVGSASDSAYAFLGGTSMSAPNVTGSLLLLQQYHHQIKGTYLNNASLKALAIHGARPCKLNVWGPDYSCGWGIPNFSKSAMFISDSIHHKVLERTLQNQDSFVVFVYINPTDTFKSTLVWTDPKGITSPPIYNDTTLKLVNDLDMRLLYLNDSVVAMPFVLNPNQPALSATNGDNFRDNVEQIMASQLLAGWYKIKIKHKGSLQNGTAQKFALVMSASQTLNALPVTYLNLSASAIAFNQIRLQWKTASEINNKSFEIYQGHDEASLIKVGELSGNGTSNQVQSYTYQVYNAQGFNRTQFFRVKQIDFDGHYSWSKVLRVEPNLDGRLPLVFPNPFNNQISVQTSANYPSLTIRLLSVTGFLLVEKEFNHSNQFLHQLDVAFLPPGMYIMALYNPSINEQLIFKLIKNP